MKDNYTYVAVLVDRSGSMSSIRDDAEGGLKQMVAEQRALPGDLTIDLYQFDDHYDHFGSAIDQWTLVPRGMTALLDAMGRSITDVGATLSAKPEHERPDKVVFVVVTDGMENASREWTHQRVMDAVRHQEDAYNWQFVFLAANQDAIAAGESVGVASAMNYEATSAGTRSMWSTVGDSLNLYRSGLTDTVVLPEHAGE